MSLLATKKGKSIKMLAVQSGGNWNNGSNAGVWTTNLNNYRSNSNNNVGFRSDCRSPSDSNASNVRGNSGTTGMPLSCAWSNPRQNHTHPSFLVVPASFGSNVSGVTLL
jgi:hypothetical protein